MKTASIREAKAHLNELLTLAEKGEDVLILRGSKVIARLQPVREEDLTLEPTLTDAQAGRFWNQIKEDERAGRFEEFPSVEEGVRVLRRRLKLPAKP